MLVENIHLGVRLELDSADAYQGYQSANVIKRIRTDRNELASQLFSKTTTLLLLPIPSSHFY